MPEGVADTTTNFFFLERIETILDDYPMTMTMTMTMTHSEKSHIGQMRAWPYRQECRGHGPTKKNLSYR